VFQFYQGELELQICLQVNQQLIKGFRTGIGSYFLQVQVFGPAVQGPQACQQNQVLD
jgi:hypothetical protein